MNPKKKSRRYRVSVSIHALDLAIYRFTHSLALIKVHEYTDDLDPISLEYFTVYMTI